MAWWLIYGVLGTKAYGCLPDGFGFLYIPLYQCCVDEDCRYEEACLGCVRDGLCTKQKFSDNLCESCLGFSTIVPVPWFD